MGGAGGWAGRVELGHEVVSAAITRRVPQRSLLAPGHVRLPTLRRDRAALEPCRPAPDYFPAREPSLPVQTGTKPSSRNVCRCLTKNWRRHWPSRTSRFSSRESTCSTGYGNTFSAHNRRPPDRSGAMLRGHLPAAFRTPYAAPSRRNAGLHPARNHHRRSGEERVHAAGSRRVTEISETDVHSGPNLVPVTLQPPE